MSLYRSIRDGDWEKAQSLLRSADDTVLTVEARDVQLEFTQQRDAIGATVFHFACANSEIPVDLVVSMLDTAGPSCSHAVDRAGSSAVHYATALGSHKVLAVLLQRLPLSLQIGNNKTFCPCKLAWYTYLHKRPSEQTSHALKERIYHLVRAYNLQALSKDVRELWNKTMMLASHLIRMILQRPNNKQTSTWNAVAALVRFGAMDPLDCPTMAVWFALQVTTDCDLLEPLDSKGNLLLHTAAASTPLSILQLPPVAAAYMKRKADGEWNWFAQRSVLAQLCYKEPDAAAAKNAAGRLPLHVAIACGKPWVDGIEVLLHAYPDAIYFPDPVTGLEPLLHAAHSKNCDLTTLFELMRNNADAIFAAPW